MEKKRFDYSVLSLIKADNVTKYDGMGIDDLTAECRDYLANYGLFVILTRSLAGHENDSPAEKKAILTATFKWFTDGMPKRTKVGVDAFTAACNKIMASDTKAADKKSAIKVLESVYGKTFEQN